MAIIRNPYAIIEPNRLGHLLITWPSLAIREPDVNEHGRDIVVVTPVELYVQSESDIQAVKESLPADLAAELDKGWTVRTYKLPADYIPE
jgi:hypothetical protein